MIIIKLTALSIHSSPLTLIHILIYVVLHFLSLNNYLIRLLETEAKYTQPRNATILESLCNEAKETRRRL